MFFHKLHKLTSSPIGGVSLIRKMLVLLISCLAFSPLVSSATDEQVWIVEMDDAPEPIDEYIEKNYPLIEVVHVYDTLLDAVALKGKERHVKEFYQESFVTQFHEAKTYQVPANQGNSPEANTANYHPPSIEQTGKNVKVGVIDTGIDYTHADLERNYQSGFDVVDFDDDPMETTHEQGLPTVHGTHVAGIIAANGRITGVAPDAELYGYRALGPGGIGTTAEIIAALEEAANDGMDIINLSLGNEVNSPDSPLTEAVNEAVSLGISVVVANGNSGPDHWTVGSPATAEKAISVGAYAPEISRPFIELPGQERIDLIHIPTSSKWNFTKRMPLVKVDSLETLEDSIHDRVVLLKKEKSYVETVSLLMKKGVSGLILYSDEDPNEWEMAATPFPVAYLSTEDANALASQSWITTEYAQLENQLAVFSSRGPVTTSWEVKPDIIAPGVNILSTVPEGYAELQGTSMAAPYVTGILALLAEKHPNASPQELKNRLLTYAKPIGEDETLSPIDQGAGTIQLDESMQADFTIENKTLNFGKMDTETTVEETITIKNHTAEPLFVRWDIPRKQEGLQWRLPFQTEIAPQSEKKFPVELTVNTDRLEEDMLEGYLSVRVGDDDIEIPYTMVTSATDYPRISGVELEAIPFSDNEFKLSLYLPEAVDQLDVALITEDLHQTTPLLEQSEVKKGKFEEKIMIENLGEVGQYLVVQVEQGDET